MRLKRIRRLVRDLGTFVFRRWRYSRDGLANVDRLRLDTGLRTRCSVLRVCRDWYIVRPRRRLGSGRWRRRVLNLRRQRRHLSCGRSWSRCRSRCGRRRQGLWHGLSVHLSSLDVSKLGQQDVRHFHCHAAEIGNQMHTSCVTSERTLGAFARILLAERQHVTAMTTPTCAEVAEWLESMGNTMINLFLIALL